MLKGKVTSVEFHATLEIDCKTAEILGYCMGYNLDDFIVEKCTKRFKKEDVQAAFRELRTACEEITQTKEKAFKAMNAALRGEKDGS